MSKKKPALAPEPVAIIIPDETAADENLQNKSNKDGTVQTAEYYYNNVDEKSQRLMSIMEDVMFKRLSADVKAIDIGDGTKKSIEKCFNQVNKSVYLKVNKDTSTYSDYFRKALSEDGMLNKEAIQIKAILALKTKRVENDQKIGQEFIKPVKEDVRVLNKYLEKGYEEQIILNSTKYGGKFYGVKFAEVQSVGSLRNCQKLEEKLIKQNARQFTKDMKKRQEGCINRINERSKITKDKNEEEESLERKRLKESESKLAIKKKADAAKRMNTHKKQVQAELKNREKFEEQYANSYQDTDPLYVRKAKAYVHPNDKLALEISKKHKDFYSPITIEQIKAHQKYIDELYSKHVPYKSQELRPNHFYNNPEFVENGNNVTSYKNCHIQRQELQQRYDKRNQLNYKVLESFKKNMKDDQVLSKTPAQLQEEMKNELRELMHEKQEKNSELPSLYFECAKKRGRLGIQNRFLEAKKPKDDVGLPPINSDVKKSPEPTATKTQEPKPKKTPEPETKFFQEKLPVKKSQ